MKSLRAQYFFSYAVMGAFIPYLAVFLRQRELSDQQSGWVQSAWGLAVLLSPVLMTLAADLHVPNRRLLRLAFVGCGVAMGVMAALTHFWPLLIAYTVAALALTPALSLQDGLNFAEQDRRSANGMATVPYHRVRIYGTLGYIVPSLLLYVLLGQGVPIMVIMLAAAVLCAAGAFNTFFLPHPPGHEQRLQKSKLNLPTLAALKTMLQPQLLIFCLAMWLCQAAVAGYYSFYPLYLTESVGIDQRWLGLISSIGVMMEIPLVLGFGWLLARMSLRWLLTACLLATALRLGLLSQFDNMWAAIGTQLLHGPLVLVVHVAPPVYLNRCAQPGYRNSIQGLYAVLIMGTGRLVGNAAAGYAAHQSLGLLFGLECGLLVLAAAMIGLRGRGWHEVKP
ncbi:MAG: MFS transporter [Phycisphaeraceae bacterium]|nr:MFS transporter [Phycisphaeraceae bacterium]